MDANRFLGRGRYLKKENVLGGPKTLTIEEVDTVTFGDGDDAEERLQLTLSNRQRFNLNSTNLQMLISAFGSNTEDWFGQDITFVHDPDVVYLGRRTGGVRIRVPGRTAAAPTASTEQEDEGPVPF
jgi:hypothetical protein